MKAKPDCIPCIIAHVLKVARNVTPNDWLARKVLLETLDILKTGEFDRSPAEIAFDCLRTAAKTLGTLDPFKEEKRVSNESAMAIIEEVNKIITDKNEDKLLSLLRFAAAANLLDTGTLSTATPQDITLLTSRMNFELNNYAALKKDLASAKSILYILDNAGEIVFDKLVIEELARKGKDVTAVVRKFPVLNDAVSEDAEQVGLTAVCPVIDTGADSLGVVLNVASPKFREIFESADVVISKGQANFETIEGIRKNTYFVLTTKCDVVANYLGVSKNDLVLLRE
ncbi:MAG: ARMT1-like domain-containing protein [Planctomycetota bacterium]